MWRLLGAWRASRRGAFAVLAAMIGGVVALGSAAAIDVATLNRLETALKHAVDQGALAAARASDNHALSGESFFDLSIADDRDHFAVLEKQYRQEGEEHIMLARGEMKPIVLGMLGLSVIEVGAESAAIAGESVSAAPCLSLKETTGTALRLNPGARVEGEGCTVVLNSAQTGLLDIAPDAELAMEGFCLRVEATKAEIEALSARLGLPHLPEICDTFPEEEAAFPAATSCAHPVFDQNNPMGTGANGKIMLEGTTYCGEVFYNRMDADFTISNSMFEAWGGSMTFDVRSLHFDNMAFISDGAITLRTLETSTIAASDRPPYAGYAIVQKPGGMGGRITFSDHVRLDGKIYAPGGEIVIESGLTKASASRPIVAGSITLGSGANLALSPEDGTPLAEVSTARPRLVR